MRRNNENIKFSSFAFYLSANSSKSFIKKLIKSFKGDEINETLINENFIKFISLYSMISLIELLNDALLIKANNVLMIIITFYRS